MNFEVNGVPYLLTFDQSHAQWLLLVPSREGIAPLEIHSDATPEFAAARGNISRRRH